MHKKSVRWTAALCAAGLLLAGCGPVAGDSGAEKIRLMVWSPSEDQSKDSGQWLQTCCENFAALHPEWDITFVYGVSDEASAAGAVAQDPEASADVFMYANDTLTVMTDANALAKFGGIYAEELQATNSETLLDSLTLDGNIYGVPFTTNTWYMYYDKSVFTEEDVKSLDTMLEKGVVSFPFVNSWYLPAFYFGNGCTLFGDGTQEELGADFGGENAVEGPSTWWTWQPTPTSRSTRTVPVWRDCGTAASTPSSPAPGMRRRYRRSWATIWAWRPCPPTP